jgi:hypothetical protein
LRQLLKSIPRRDEPAPAGQFPQVVFERLERLIRPANFLAFEGKPKKVGLVGWSNLAFGRVNLEFQLNFDKAFDAGHYPFSGSPASHKNKKVSSPGESHFQALSEPDVNLSAHPAPIIQPKAKPPSASGQKALVRGVLYAPTNAPPVVDGGPTS